MKIIDWRTGKQLQIGDIADWGPPPKFSTFYSDVKGEMTTDAQGNSVGVMTVNPASAQRVPYPPEFHDPGYQLLEIEDNWTRGRVKLRSLKNDQIVWWPLSIRFFTKDGWRIGYIID